MAALKVDRYTVTPSASHWREDAALEAAAARELSGSSSVIRWPRVPAGGELERVLKPDIFTIYFVQHTSISARGGQDVAAQVPRGARSGADRHHRGRGMAAGGRGRRDRGGLAHGGRARQPGRPDRGRLLRQPDLENRRRRAAPHIRR